MPPRGFVIKSIPIPDITTIIHAKNWPKRRKYGEKFLYLSSARPIKSKIIRPVKIPTISKSIGINRKIETTIAMKHGSPPALGTILFCMWAGCGLFLGLSKRPYFFANFMVKGIAIIVIKNAVKPGNKKFICVLKSLDKDKNYFKKTDCQNQAKN